MTSLSSPEELVPKHMPCSTAEDPRPAGIELGPARDLLTVAFTSAFVRPRSNSQWLQQVFSWYPATMMCS